MSNTLAEMEKQEDWKCFLAEMSKLVEEGGGSLLPQIWLTKYIGQEILLELLKEAKKDIDSLLTSEDELKREVGKFLSE